MGNISQPIPSKNKQTKSFRVHILGSGGCNRTFRRTSTFFFSFPRLLSFLAWEIHLLISTGWLFTVDGTCAFLAWLRSTARDAMSPGKYSGVRDRGRGNPGSVGCSIFPRLCRKALHVTACYTQAVQRMGFRYSLLHPWLCREGTSCYSLLYSGCAEKALPVTTCHTLAVQRTCCPLQPVTPWLWREGATRYSLLYPGCAEKVLPVTACYTPGCAEKVLPVTACYTLAVERRRCPLQPVIPWLWREGAARYSLLHRGCAEKGLSVTACYTLAVQRRGCPLQPVTPQAVQRRGCPLQPVTDTLG